MKPVHVIASVLTVCLSVLGLGLAVPTCDVLVLGGSTAALAAAITSGKQGVLTCLLEPTDWPGGQLTANGVPAIDFAWKGPFARYAHYNKNLPQDFAQLLDLVKDTGACSVSRDCFLPTTMLKAINDLIQSVPKLTVLTNTVVKNVHLNAAGTSIISVTVVMRTLKIASSSDPLPSVDMLDWYSTKPSSRYDKQVLTIPAKVFVDASELGELLALSGASYLQGTEKEEGSLQVYDDRCGQAIGQPFIMQLNHKPVSDSAPQFPPQVPIGYYNFGKFNWDFVWIYRRLFTNNRSGTPHVGDLSSMNWQYGNDFAYGYLLKSVEDTKTELKSDWYGGINYTVLSQSEMSAFNFFQWYRAADPRGSSLSLDLHSFGTSHGLSKFPYIRDTRRSIGVGDFILTVHDISSGGDNKSALKFPDRVGIGLYTVDVHLIEPFLCKNGKYPPYLQGKFTDPLPFFIPLRALTNRDIGNLLVGGKTMAQSFLANSATRVHPIEWSSGTAAGAAAAVMAQLNVDSTELLKHASAVQAAVILHAPIDWNFQEPPNQAN